MTSFSITGDELDELVRLLLRGFSSSSEQLTPEKKWRDLDLEGFIHQKEETEKCLL